MDGKVSGRKFDFRDFIRGITILKFLLIFFEWSRLIWKEIRFHYFNFVLHNSCQLNFQSRTNSLRLLNMKIFQHQRQKHTATDNFVTNPPYFPSNSCWRRNIYTEKIMSLTGFFLLLLYISLPFKKSLQFYLHASKFFFRAIFVKQISAESIRNGAKDSRDVIFYSQAGKWKLFPTSKEST